LRRSLRAPRSMEVLGSLVERMLAGMTVSCHIVAVERCCTNDVNGS
jgi:hypothetical protein